MSHRYVAAILFLALLATASAHAGTTHGYRGINTSGYFAGKGLLKKWPKGGPKLLWKHFAAGGFAGPLIKDGKVYLIGGNPGRLYVLTLDGKLLATIPMGPSDWKRFSGSRSTPLVYGNLVFGQMPNANVYAVDLETQETKWTLNAWKSIGSGKGNMGWGVPESPMLHKGKIILNPCSRDELTPGLVALHAETGETAWELPGRVNAKRFSAADVSGALFCHNGRWLVAYPTWCYLLCVDADTGKLLWEIPNTGSKNLTPVYSNGLLLWGSADGRLQMFKLSKDGSSYEVLWTRRGMVSGYSHAVTLDGRVYAFCNADAPVDDTRRSPQDNCAFMQEKPARAPRGRGGLVSIDALTGKTIHVEAGLGGGTHVAAADGMVYAVTITRKGRGKVPKVSLIQPTTNGFEVAGTLMPDIDPESANVSEVEWEARTCPTIAEGRLFLRYGSLFVYDLRIEQPSYGWRVDGSGIAPNTGPPIKWSKKENILWTCKLPDAARAAPAVNGEKVYVLHGSGLAAVGAGSGIQQWTTPLSERAQRLASGTTAHPTPVARESMVYAARNDGALACINADGKRLWSVRVEPQPGNVPLTSPVLSEDVLVIQAKYLSGLSVRDGKQLWRVPLPDSKAYTTPVKERLAGGNILVTGWGAVVRAADGAVLNGELPPLENSSPVVSDEIAYLCGKSGRKRIRAAFRLHAPKGDAMKVEELWQHKQEFTADGSPLMHDGLLYVVDTDSRLHVIDAANGKEIYEQQLTSSGEAKDARPADLVLAKDIIYAPALGERRITVGFRPGREFEQAWQYACKHPSPGNPAFVDKRQFICAGKTLYCIGGKTPIKPVPPAVRAIAPDESLGGANGIPLSIFESGKSPRTWLSLGPFRKRTITLDHLAAVGGVSNAVLRSNEEVKYKSRGYRTKKVVGQHWWTDKKFTKNVRAIDVSGVLQRRWNSTGYFGTVVEFDKPQHVRFSDLTPLGILWNPKSRLDMATYFSGTKIEPGEIIKVDKGRYPLTIQVAMGKCESWGKIWFAPRFDNVDDEVDRKQKDFERRMRDWPAYRESLKQLFVLGE